MRDVREITNDFKEMQRTFIENQFGGGNAGAALAGRYIADSNKEIAKAIREMAQTVDRLARAVDVVANRPINVVVNTVSARPTTQSRKTKK